MSSPKESTDTTGDKAHEACGWRKFTNDDITSDDSDDGGIKVVAQKYSEDTSCKTRKNDDMIVDKSKLQGVVIVSLSDNKTSAEVIKGIIDNNTKDKSDDDLCIFNDSNNLILDNKYFKANVQLLDYTSQMQLEDCHAVVIYVDGEHINFDQLNEAKLSVAQVQGEPRILACDTFEDSQKCTSIMDWCLNNEYEFIPNLFELHLEDEQEGGYKRFLDSLSAYRWPHLKMKQTKDSVSNSNKQFITQNKDGSSTGSDMVLNSDIMKKIEDFDELLTKLNRYRGATTDQQSHSRNDDELLEIAQKLSSILGDDYGDLLQDASL